MGQKIADLARDTSALFTGGTSGVNVAKGEAPTAQTALTDASGLAAGAGLAGAGLGGTAAAGGSAVGPGAADAIGLVPGDAFMPGALAPGNVSAVGGTVAGDAFMPGALAPQAGVPASVGLPLGSEAMRALRLNGGVPSGPAGQTGAGGAAPAGGGTAPAAAPGAPVAPSAPAAGSAASSSGVDGILKAMRENAGLIQLGLAGTSLAMAGQQKPIPNEQQLNELATSGSQVAKDLIQQYRSGQISAAQQAQLDQVTQQTRNQINQYFASIGQSDSTAHMQALAQVDQQALAMKQQFLNNALTQGLSAIGVAQGPLKAVADYQLQQDRNLTDAFGNFAGAVGQVFGRTAGTTAAPTVTGQTPSSGVAIRNQDQSTSGNTSAQQ